MYRSIIKWKGKEFIYFDVYKYYWEGMWLDMTKEEFDKWFYSVIDEYIEKDYKILLALAWTIL